MSADAQLGDFADAPSRSLRDEPGVCMFEAVCGNDAPGPNRICDACLELVRINDERDGLEIGDRSILAHVERLYRHYGWYGGEGEA